MATAVSASAGACSPEMGRLDCRASRHSGSRSSRRRGFRPGLEAASSGPRPLPAGYRPRPSRAARGRLGGKRFIDRLELAERRRDDRPFADLVVGRGAGIAGAPAWRSLSAGVRGGGFVARRRPVLRLVVLWFCLFEARRRVLPPLAHGVRFRGFRARPAGPSRQAFRPCRRGSRGRPAADSRWKSRNRGPSRAADPSTCGPRLAAAGSCRGSGRSSRGRRAGGSAPASACSGRAVDADAHANRASALRSSSPSSPSCCSIGRRGRTPRYSRRAGIQCRGRRRQFGRGARIHHLAQVQADTRLDPGGGAFADFLAGRSVEQIRGQRFDLWGEDIAACQQARPGRPSRYGSCRIEHEVAVGRRDEGFADAPANPGAARAAPRL